MESFSDTPDGVIDLLMIRTTAASPPCPSPSQVAIVDRHGRSGTRGDPDHDPRVLLLPSNHLVTADRLTVWRLALLESAPSRAAQLLNVSVCPVCSDDLPSVALQPASSLAIEPNKHAKQSRHLCNERSWQTDCSDTIADLNRKPNCGPSVFLQCRARRGVQGRKLGHLTCTTPTGSLIETLVTLCRDRVTGGRTSPLQVESTPYQVLEEELASCRAVLTKAIAARQARAGRVPHMNTPAAVADVRLVGLSQSEVEAVICA